MGAKIKFGSRVFDAIGKGRLAQSQVAIKQARWGSQTSGAVALTAINASASFAANVPVVVGTGLVNLKNIVCMAFFYDGSTGATYNVSDLSHLYVYQSQFTNLDKFSAPSIPRFPHQAGGIEYEILLSVQPTGGLAIDAIIYAGDILSKTGITPAVTDTVTFFLSALYEPL